MIMHAPAAWPQQKEQESFYRKISDKYEFVLRSQQDPHDMRMMFDYERKSLFIRRPEMNTIDKHIESPAKPKTLRFT